MYFRWMQTGSLQASSHISSLSWNLEGTRLLTGGVKIQMWHEKITTKEEEPNGKSVDLCHERNFQLLPIHSFTVVTFEIGDRDPRTPPAEEETVSGWECVWKCHTATPVHHMAFSPDGTLFATSGKSDRLVKVWYENKHCKYTIPYHSYYKLVY